MHRKSSFRQPSRGRQIGAIGLALWCLCASLPGFGQVRDGSVIESIEWSGLESYSEETLAYYLGLEVGGTLDLKQLNEKIHLLWTRDVIDHIEIDGEPGERGVLLVVRVSEKPLLRGVDYEGLKKLSRTDVDDNADRERVRVVEGGPLERGELERLRAVIKEAYRDKGYRFADVDYRMETVNPGEVRVIFSIDEGDKVKIDDIDFEGNSVFGDRRLRLAMKKTKETGLITRIMRRDVFNPATFEEDLDSVRDLYRERGYKDILIGEPEVDVVAKRPGAADPRDQKRRLTLTIPIDEGERWRLGDISIEGNEVYSDELLLRVFQRPGGDWLKASLIDKGIEAIDEAYRNSGYLYAQVDSELREREGTIADVIVHVHEGDQYRVGRLEFSGNTRTRDKVLRREFRVHEGQVLNMGAIKSSLFKIRQLEYFTLDEDDPVEFKNFDTEKQTVDLVLKGQESDRTEILFGGGYSGLDGFFGQISLRTRNFLGRGETAGINVQAGGVRNVFDLSYFIPWFLDRPQSVGIQLFKNDFDFDLGTNQRFKRESLGGVLSYGRSLGLFQSLGISASVSEIDDFQAATDILGNPITQEFALANRSIRPSWSYDSRDSRIEPTQGSRYALSVEYAGGPLGGDNNFWRPELALTYFRPLTRVPVKTVFGVNLEAGQIFPFGDEPLSPLETYFRGGDNSVRGFRRNTLSVRITDLDDPTCFNQNPQIGDYCRDRNGFLVGGAKFLEFSLEYHVLLGGPFRLVLFGDAGNVFSENQSFSLSDLRTTAGAELRIFAPVFGVPLRFIYAFNLDEQPGDRFESFQFNVGTSF